MRNLRTILAALALIGLAAPAGCGGGGGGTGAVFDPGQTTPTRLTTADGRVSVLIPTDALSSEVRLTLTNRSAADAAVPGPAGRSLVMALEFTGANPPAGAGEEPADEPKLAASVDVTFVLPFSLRTDISMPAYSYNSVSQRYEGASLSGTPTPADPLDTATNMLKFTINSFGRYAVYSLLDAELPPAVPQNLRLLAASSQVRRLAWDSVADPAVVGYNLYRADASQSSLSYSKLNTSSPLAGLAYSDELSAAGDYSYRVTSVTVNGVESDPSAAVDSPAVPFDVAFTFGAGILEEPSAIAIDTERDRVVVADTAQKELHVFNLAGAHTLHLEHYPGGQALDPRGLAFNADGSWLYMTDGGLAQCRIFDAEWNVCGEFGTPGTGPGEFGEPGAVLVTGTQVLVADSGNSTLQAFTPQGVYLRTLAQPGLEEGQLDTPSALFTGKGGRLYLSDAKNNRVQLFKGGDFAFEKLLDYPAEDGGPLLAPDGISEDFRARLYVSDTGNHRVVVFDSSQKFLFHFGADGALTVEFSTDSGPRGMALDSTTGYLYVCDPGNHRIAVFKT